MSATENKEFMKRYAAALGKDKSPEVVDQYVSDEELKHHIAIFEVAFPGYQLKFNDMVAEGDKVAVNATMSGTHKGELMGIPATGKSVSISLMLFYRLEDGKIAQHWMVADQLSLLQQIGALAAPA